MQRMHFSNYFVCVADGNQLPTVTAFDKILIDAPCTGFGVLNKRVDLKWKRTEQDIQNMKGIQLDLLRAAANYLKPNGCIVYSTCTIEPEENEKVIEEFLAGNKDFRQENLKGIIPDMYLGNNYYVQTFPHRHKMDGSFVAKIRKLAK